MLRCNRRADGLSFVLPFIPRPYRAWAEAGRGSSSRFPSYKASRGPLAAGRFQLVRRQGSVPPFEIADSVFCPDPVSAHSHSARGRKCWVMIGKLSRRVYIRRPRFLHSPVSLSSRPVDGCFIEPLSWCDGERCVLPAVPGRVDMTESISCRWYLAVLSRARH